MNEPHEANGAADRRFRDRTIRVVALVLVVIGGWALVAFGWVPGIIRDVYTGNGPDFLTTVFAGRSEHPVDRYLDRWDVVAREALVSLVGLSVAMLIWTRRRLSWDDHWFAPGRPRDLATARLVLVGLQLILLVLPVIPGCSGCALEDHAFRVRSTADWYQPILLQKVLLIPFGWGVRPDMGFLTAVKAVGVVAGLLALAGPLGRLSLVVFAWCATVLVSNTYSYGGEYHHSEGLLLVALWALALAPSYRALTWRSKRGSESAPPLARGGRTGGLSLWPLRLMQWMLAITYFDAGVAKLLKPDLGWFQPTTLSYYLARDGLMAGSSVGIWMAEQAWVLPLFAVGTVGLELGFFIAVLIPRAALPLVAAMTALHVGIFVAQWAPFPQHIALLWVSFLPWIRWTTWRTS